MINMYGNNICLFRETVNCVGKFLTVFSTNNSGGTNDELCDLKSQKKGTYIPYILLPTVVHTEALGGVAALRYKPAGHGFDSR
jgi:hypothetical protein